MNQQQFYKEYIAQEKKEAQPKIDEMTKELGPVAAKMYEHMLFGNPNAEPGVGLIDLD